MLQNADKTTDILQHILVGGNTFLVIAYLDIMLCSP